MDSIYPPSERPAVRFPTGRQFALTWGIPDDFGGMTSAMLHRSRAFVRLAGQPVEVLTFDARVDYAEVRQQLRDRGELIDGMGLINLWEWLRDNDVTPDAPGRLTLDKHSFLPLDGDAQVSASSGDRVLVRTRTAGTSVLQVDYFRQDGSLLVSDRRDVTERGVLGGRSVVLCDRRGEPFRSWGSIWGLYRFWLDLVTRGESSFLLVDSKPIATFIASYRRDKVVVLHIVHASHLEGDDRSRLRESRRAVFENLYGYDSVVLLTQRQRVEVEGLLGRHLNLAVIGNGRELGPPPQRVGRAPGAGVMLASLTERKRVNHAIQAIAWAHASHPEVRLEVFGEGDRRGALEVLIAETEAPVLLRGHDLDAREHLAAASFLLLTSTSEGLPLVLVEAMAAGCIPIAYDIPYGPADLIRDGRNGYLVPAGDIDGVARAITALQQLSPRQVEKMRARARQAAEPYSDLATTKAWAKELRAASLRHTAAMALRPVVRKAQGR